MGTTSETCIWVGATGTNYTYYIHPLPVTFNSNQQGNYIWSKLNSENKWVPIYIGEGELSDRVSDQHHKIACIKAKGASHVHVHTNSDENKRKSEESDLLARYTNAYVPDGCNEKLGG